MNNYHKSALKFSTIQCEGPAISLGTSSLWYSPAQPHRLASLLAKSSKHSVTVQFGISVLQLTKEPDLVLGEYCKTTFCSNGSKWSITAPSNMAAGVRGYRALGIWLVLLRKWIFNINLNSHILLGATILGSVLLELSFSLIVRSYDVDGQNQETGHGSYYRYESYIL